MRTPSKEGGFSTTTKKITSTQLTSSRTEGSFGKGRGDDDCLMQITRLPTRTHACLARVYASRPARPHQLLQAPDYSHGSAAVIGLGARCRRCTLPNPTGEREHNRPGELQMGQIRAKKHVYLQRAEEPVCQTSQHSWAGQWAVLMVRVGRLSLRPNERSRPLDAVKPQPLASQRQGSDLQPCPLNAKRFSCRPLTMAQ